MTPLAERALEAARELSGYCTTHKVDTFRFHCSKCIAAFLLEFTAEVLKAHQGCECSCRKYRAAAEELRR